MARKKKKDEASPETSKVNQNVKNALMDIEMEASIFLTDEAESDGFLPEPTPEAEAELEAEAMNADQADDDSAAESKSRRKKSAAAKSKAKAKTKSKSKMKAAATEESEMDSEDTEMSEETAEESVGNEMNADSESTDDSLEAEADSNSDSEQDLEVAREADGDDEENEQLFESSEEMENKDIEENEDGHPLEAASDEEVSSLENESVEADLEGTELDGFESADIEEVEFVEEEQLHSIVESILFASDRPVSLASIQLVFKGTNVRKDKIRRVLDNLAVEYASGRRGVVLEEVTGGYQLRTKVDNMNFLKRGIKTKAFKLSGPALETLSIVAYKQPVVKVEIDQIRGVESGHLLRALMEKGLVNFEGKAETLPGKPMQYGTTRRFLEIFGLRNLKELPTLSQIDELLPEGIGDENEEKETLSMVTDSMAEEHKAVSYSEGEEELGQIEEQLTSISTSSEFFEQEKLRQKQKRDEEKAQNIREALAVGETVSKRDLNWLKKFENPEPAPTEIHAENANAESTETSTASDSESGEANELNLADQALQDDRDLDDELSAAEDEDGNDDDETSEERGYKLAQNNSDESDDDDEEDELPFYDEADEPSEDGHV